MSITPVRHPGLVSGRPHSRYEVAIAESTPASREVATRASAASTCAVVQPADKVANRPAGRGLGCVRHPSDRGRVALVAIRPEWTVEGALQSLGLAALIVVSAVLGGEPTVWWMLLLTVRSTQSAP
jgi:hypothetical protein